MPDMLVKLYELPSLDSALVPLNESGIELRRALLPEHPLVLGWVREHFPPWASEVAAAFNRLPVSCFLALGKSRIIGFAAYDVTARNFFGPTGVADDCRGRGVGRALLLACLHEQRAQGYAYSIIGGVGPAAYYEKAVGATIIEGSTPGIYGGALGDDG